MRALVFMLVLSGCVSIDDIDTSHANSACATQCSASYSFCVSPSGALIPRAINNYQCKDGFRACINSCPMK